MRVDEVVGDHLVQGRDIPLRHRGHALLVELDDHVAIAGHVPSSSLIGDVLSADQHQLALQVAPLADPVRLGRVGELVAGDRRRPHRAGLQQLVHAFEMRPVARDARPQHLDIAAARLEPGRRRRDPHQPAAGLQHLVRAHLHLAADRIEHDVAPDTLLVKSSVL